MSRLQPGVLSGDQLECVLVLDNIRSAYNVGAIFRTADAAGVTKVFLVGCTPCPIDRFGRAVPEIHKTALGAEQQVAWEYVATAEAAVAHLAPYAVVAVEQGADAQSIFTYQPTNPLALVFGNEITGVSEPLLTAAATIVDLPMWGSKESLNVSVSVGAALYTVRYIQYAARA